MTRPRLQRQRRSGGQTDEGKQTYRATDTKKPKDLQSHAQADGEMHKSIQAGRRRETYLRWQADGHKDTRSDRETYGRIVSVIAKACWTAMFIEVFEEQSICYTLQIINMPGLWAAIRAARRRTAGQRRDGGSIGEEEGGMGREG